MAQKDYLALIGDILKTQMSLQSEQIFLQNQKKNIAPTYDLNIRIFVLGGVAISNRIFHEDTDEGYKETITTTMNERLQIEVFGGTEARLRKQEVVMALYSDYSQNVQCANSFSLSRNPGPFQNLSFLEQTAVLDRYLFELFMTAAYETERIVDYYSAFEAKVYTDPKTQNPIIFNAQENPL